MLVCRTPKFAFRWDYAQDERDTEIAELKKRLVEAEHKAKEAAGKAADELKVLASDLQVRRHVVSGSCRMANTLGT